MPAAKYLVVDGSATMRRIVANSLQRMGPCEVLEAADETEALQKFDTSVGFIIADWPRSNLSGVDFVRQVRARDDGKQVPILMMSTRAQRADIMAALEAGVNHYVVKPFTQQLFKEKLDALVAVPSPT